MQISLAEENYLKSIYFLVEQSKERISTNSIAARLNISAATVTDMLQRLSQKKLINYQKYYGVHLTPAGKKLAVSIIRRHRLWELFLVEKLGFDWSQVHELAEELEHIKSELLINRLYQFLGKPDYDPHGDPIPDDEGNFPKQHSVALTSAKEHSRWQISGVVNHDAGFLKYLDERGLIPGQKIRVEEVIAFDKSMTVYINSRKKSIHLSREAAENILVETL